MEAVFTVSLEKRKVNVFQEEEAPPGGICRARTVDQAGIRTCHKVSPGTCASDLPGINTAFSRRNVRGQLCCTWSGGGIGDIDM